MRKKVQKITEEHWSGPNGCHEDCPACATKKTVVAALIKGKTKYTVVGLCRCGCDDSFIDFIEAGNPGSAARQVLLKREHGGIVTAVFEGEQENKLPFSVARS